MSLAMFSLASYKLKVFTRDIKSKEACARSRKRPFFFLKCGLEAFHYLHRPQWHQVPKEGNKVWKPFSSALGTLGKVPVAKDDLLRRTATLISGVIELTGHTHTSLSIFIKFLLCVQGPLSKAFSLQLLVRGPAKYLKGSCILLGLSCMVKLRIGLV